MSGMQGQAGKKLRDTDNTLKGCSALGLSAPGVSCDMTPHQLPEAESLSGNDRNLDSKEN